MQFALKHEDVEEPIDLLVYRPLGAALTRSLVPTSVTPNQVTVASAIVGAIGGHFFLYDNLAVNVAGMLSFALANTLDSVDGQLARAKKMTSRLGRVLDGVAGVAIFGSVYLHLAIRLARDGHGWVAYVLCALALLSQAIQNQMADYFRNAYLTCALPEAGGELDSGADARRLHDKARRAGRWHERVLFKVYRDYVGRQELLAPWTARMHRRISSSTHEERLAAAARYRELSRPVLRHLPWIATNFRMLALFALLCAGRPDLFFPLNIVPLNLALLLIVALNERNSRKVLRAMGGPR